MPQYHAGMTWSKPETVDVQATLRTAAPQFADKPIAFLAEGWEFWAFESGDHVLRFPKNEASVTSLRLERALLPALAEHLTVPVPRIDVWGEKGPNGAPFSGHLKLPGTHVWPNGDAPIGKPGPNFGRQLGTLIRELHSFPALHAKALGVRDHDIAYERSKRIEHFEAVIRRVFPLVSCEARTHIESVYRAAINDASYYSPSALLYTPRHRREHSDRRRGQYQRPHRLRGLRNRKSGDRFLAPGLRLRPARHR